MNQQSKPISKTDEDAKKLIIESLDGNVTGGFDIDSIYLIANRYVVLEFLKCDSVRPYNSHPNRYWFKNSQKFISLWQITKKLEGSLFLINYEDSREQFKVIEVIKLTRDGIIKENTWKLTFDEFKNWFQKLNRDALNS